MDPHDLRRFTRHCTFPFLHGVYLAVNAIPDLYLLVDAPPCAFTKAEEIHGTHDLASTLMDVETRHRIVNTRSHVSNIIDGLDHAFVEALGDLLSADFVGGIAYTAFPMNALIGTPHEHLAAKTRGDNPRLLFSVPPRSLTEDWLQGYAELLASLAQHIPLPSVSRQSSKVALVGAFMDRNEGDHRGNAHELRRLVTALGLELVTVWLDGSPLDELARAAEAAWIVSLPHGREAARRLAARTGAALVEAPVPFGLDATDRWLHAIARATGTEPRARDVIRREHRDALERLRWFALRKLVHTRWAFAGDPWMIPGLMDMARLVGASIPWAVAWTARLPEELTGLGQDLDLRAGLDAMSLDELVATHGGAHDLLIANARVLGYDAAGHRGYVEFGFPSWHHHVISDAPFLGYRGALGFLGRLGNASVDTGYRYH